MKSLSRWVIRKADLTIVSNRQLAALVDRWGGRSFTLPDPIPVPPAVPAAARALDGAFNVVLIATHAPDEPIAQIFEAVRDTGRAPLRDRQSQSYGPAARGARAA